jgi:hypothetical protein
LEKLLLLLLLLHNNNMTEPNKKKAKVENGRVSDEMIDTLWEHYRNFLDSCDVSEDQQQEQPPDIDELQELIDIGEKKLVNVQKVSIDNDTHDDDNNTLVQAIHSHTGTFQKSRQDLLPVLMSVAYKILAESSIAEYLMMQQQQLQEPSSSSLENENIQLTLHTAQQLLVKSLEWYPYHADAWSMGANLGRMSQSLCPTALLQWYERAVITSFTVRPKALALLESQDTQEECKEWIELLLLNQVLGVEYEDDGETDAESTSAVRNDGRAGEVFENEYEGGNDNDDDNGDGTVITREDGFQNEFSEKGSQDEEEEDESEPPGHYSASRVESTARFMCAMLWSMQGDHDKALEQLKHFSLTDRIHPDVWKTAVEPSTSGGPPATLPPLVFRPSEGILPVELYNAMVKVFAPQSKYWIESDYSNRGYYSYFMEFDKSKEGRDNLLEDVIVNHLLPRAQQVLDQMKENGLIPEGESGEIKGFEWWAHTRPIQANLGHNLHFDTDESMLDQEGKVTHPILSSVLYLTGGNSPSSPAGGATIIFDQSPGSKESAQKCWQGKPQNNTFLLFPGDCLHGVLPCPGNEETSNGLPANTNKTSTTQDLINSWKPKESSRKSPQHRLTFMVGFWTRNVPETMKKRRLYGPCGPLPPATAEHTWVREIHKDYGNSSLERQVAPKSMKASALPCVSPAWETFESLEKIGVEGSSPPLTIPHRIDHRYFVRGAPKCFRDSLFEDREEVDDDCK